MNLDFTHARRPLARHLGDMAAWIVVKYREQARHNGVQYAARNLRKQGVPIEHAITILARRV